MNQQTLARCLEHATDAIVVVYNGNGNAACTDAVNPQTHPMNVSGMNQSIEVIPIAVDNIIPLGAKSPLM